MTIATALILLAMSKEHTELRHKTAAMTDPLTGLLNRRAFLQDAETLLQQQISRDRPIGVLPIHLDHFKSINDCFGHAVGDKVLDIFAKTTQANLRQTDLVGASAARSSWSCSPTPASTTPIRWRTACAMPSRSPLR